MDVVLASVKWKFALVYLEEVVVFSNTVDDHIDHLKAVLKLLKNAGLTLNLKKCFFFHNNIYYLGHVIKLGSLEVAPKESASNEKLKPSSNIT